jgi:tetratricopeptide (TPR) repeat protein
MLRHLLTDSHADVRLDASVTLARLEAKFGRAVNDATTMRSSSSSALKAYATLCFDYACSGLLDPVSSRFYLTEAREALHAYLTHDPESAETWVMLARLHANLGEMTEAMRAIDQAISLSGPSTDVFLLGMEIAFHERQWEKLIGLASHMHQEPLEIDERWRIARLWAAIPVESRNTRQLGTKRSTTAGTLRKSRRSR